MKRRTFGVAAAVPLVLTLAMSLNGCGSGGGDGKVASADNGRKSGTASPSASLSQDEMGVKFAQCLRENGVPVEDPAAGQGVTIKVDGSIGKATVDKAMETCRKYQPQGQGGPGGNDAKAEERMRKYAECMRKNGVAAFPDPQPGNGIRLDRSVAEDPDFDAAQKACQDLMGGAMATGKTQ